MITEEEKEAIEEMLFKIDKAQKTTFDFINHCYNLLICNHFTHYVPVK